MLKRTIRTFYHFAVYAVGITVLLAAVTVTMLRLLLPDIGQYRAEIEAWGSRYMGLPVVIRSVEASWRGWMPHLNLRDIDLLNKAGTESITHFDSAQVRLDLIATLARRQLVPRQLTVSGFELSVTRLGNGAITIEGINIENNDKETDKNELAEWLFKQKRIELQDADIEWIDHKHAQAPLLLRDVDFGLKTEADRIQLEGSADLPARYGSRMDFAFDAAGDLLSSAWSGELYLSARGINPDSWYKNYRPLEINIAGGNADIEVWSTWEDARLAVLEGKLSYNDFAALAHDASLHVEELAYHFKGQRSDNDDWLVNIGLDRLLTENGAWPQTTIAIATRAGTQDQPPGLAMQFSFLKLDDLMPLITRLPHLPQQAKEHLARLSLDGELHDGRIHFAPQEKAKAKLLYDIGFNKLSARLGAGLPSVADLSGRLYGDLGHGVVHLGNEAPGKINIPAFYEEGMAFSELKGALSWRYEDSAWQLDAQSIALKTDELAMHLAGRIQGGDELASPFVDLRAEIGRARLEKLADYLPRTKTFRIKNWMQRAILGGELNSASALIRGSLADFPFAGHSGQFKALANISDGVLEYSGRWPVIDNIDAEVLFRGQEMLATFHQGKIFTADIIKASAHIGDIKARQRSLSLAGQLRGQAKDATLFVAQSPLTQKPVLARLSNSLTQGEVSLDLALDIPLKPDKKDSKLRGRLALRDAAIESAGHKLTLQQIQGEVAFTKNTASSHDLGAVYAGQPVRLDIARDAEQPNQPARISIRGHSDQDFIISQLIKHSPGLSARRSWLAEKLSGEIDWSFTLHYERGAAENEIIRSLRLDSDLAGLAIDLPAPVGKSKHSSVPFRLYKPLGGKEHSTFLINYGADLSATVLFTPPTELKHIQLHFGAEEITAPAAGTGLFLSGKVNELDLSKWWKALKFSEDKAEDFIAAAAINIDIEAAVLKLFGQQFEQVAISGAKSDSMWNLSLFAEGVAGEVAIPAEWQRDKLITLELDRLHLQKINGSESEKKTIDPGLVPKLAVKIKDFFYNDKAFGEALLSATPVEDGLLIEQFSFKRPAMNIHGQGSWQQKAGQHDSSFSIELQAEDMDAMLHTFGYDLTAIRRGQTRLSIDANWAGSPLDFSLARLNGSLRMQIKKGQLLEVNPAAGRIFGLLSIQTLPRRLSLDFSDLFNQGLAFDKIAGSFEITDGNAYTNDLFMDGPAVNVAVTGRTGLSVKDYDQLVTVTPQISGNFPVAGVIFGPVGIGLGMILHFTSEMFGAGNGNINRLLRYQYTITGDWNDPVIEKFKANPKAKTSS